MFSKVITVKLSINVFNEKQIQEFYNKIAEQIESQDKPIKYRDIINLVYGVDLNHSVLVNQRQKENP